MWFRNTLAGSKIMVFMSRNTSVFKLEVIWALAVYNVSPGPCFPVSFLLLLPCSPIFFLFLLLSGSHLSQNYSSRFMSRCQILSVLQRVQPLHLVYWHLEPTPYLDDKSHLVMISDCVSFFGCWVSLRWIRDSEIRPNIQRSEHLINTKIVFALDSKSTF